MALLFVDGFDHYTTPTQKWSSISNPTYVTIAGTGRGGRGKYLSVNSLPLEADAEFVSKSLSPSPSNTIIVGAAVWVSSTWYIGGATSCGIFAVSDGITTQCTVGVTRTGSIAIYRGTSNGTLLYSGGAGVSSNAWFYIECKFVIESGTSGSVEVRINGSPTSYVTLTGVNTQNASTSNIGALLVGPYKTFSTNIFYDDLYVCDTTGSSQNTFLGDVRVDTLYPNEDGTYTQGVPSTGTTHFNLIDETPPSSTDYVTLTGVDTKDSYHIQSLPSLTSQIIHGIQINSYAAKDSGTTTAAAFVRSGTTNLESTAFAVPATPGYNQALFITDPNTSSAWTQTALNAAEVGLVIKS